MVDTFNGNLIIKIISFYSPIHVGGETDLIAFYNNLLSLVHSIPKNNVAIIGGDMNAQIVKNVNKKINLHYSSNKCVTSYRFPTRK